MKTLIDELLQQPQALHDLAAGYAAHPAWLDLSRLAAGRRLLLVGMGASFHAAAIAALHMGSLGLRAGAVEAADLLNYPPACMFADTLMVYISQSGESGEIAPLLERLEPGVPLLAVSNQPESTLVRQALARDGAYLPLLAGEEELIASKTYLNSLGVLWMLARRLSGAWEGSETGALQRVAARAEHLLAASTPAADRLVELLAPRASSGEPGLQPVTFLGHGPHALTGRQAAMLASEWPRLACLHASLGAFRHGFIEAIQPGAGVVVFAPPGSASSASAHSLAHELQSYGARLLLVENGQVRQPGEKPPENEPLSEWLSPQLSEWLSPQLSEWLSPLLDILPIQACAHTLALARGLGKGFRYLQKVVKK